MGSFKWSISGRRVLWGLFCLIFGFIPQLNNHDLFQYIVALLVIIAFLFVGIPFVRYLIKSESMFAITSQRIIVTYMFQILSKKIADIETVQIQEEGEGYGSIIFNPGNPPAVYALRSKFQPEAPATKFKFNIDEEEMQFYHVKDYEEAFRIFQKINPTVKLK